MAEDAQGPALTRASEASRLESLMRDSPLKDHPRLRAFFDCWLDTFVFDGTVDPGLRERTILRVMWRCAQPFEWGNHYRLARKVGLSDDDIVAVRTADPERDLSGAVALVVRAADEVVDVGHLTPETMAECRVLFSDAGQLYEFLYLVAGYRMMASVSASTGREHTESLWPPDGVGPSS